VGDGITVVLDSGREISLMPTKPGGLTSRRNDAMADRTFQLIAERSPEPFEPLD
jgi:hypothetical protein